MGPYASCRRSSFRYLNVNDFLLFFVQLEFEHQLRERELCTDTRAKTELCGEGKGLLSGYKGSRNDWTIDVMADLRITLGRISDTSSPLHFGHGTRALRLFSKVG